jgi:ketosteroid isomerase-like protein
VTGDRARKATAVEQTPVLAGTMRMSIVSGVLLLCACAPSSESSAVATETLIAQLSAQADRWDKAIVRKDRAAIEANMADDFRQVDGRGNVETRTSFIEGLVSPDLQIDPYTVEDFDVRIYGDVALLSGRTRMTGRYQGEPFASHYRYIDVYVHRNGEWKIVSVQITPIRNSTASQ